MKKQPINKIPKDARHRAGIFYLEWGKVMLNSVFATLKSAVGDGEDRCRFEVSFWLCSC